MATGPFAWLTSREQFGVKLGLDAVRTLLAELGDPHLNLPTVVVAGTNGKGSTAAMLAATLSAAGRRTLLYTSPHVADVRERIRVDGKPLRRDALGRRLQEVRAAVGRLSRRRKLPQQPTYFEVMTAAALLHARAVQVDAAVFEVGLGGRFDATNVIPAAVAVITVIDRDHTEYLGTTLRRIAWNKAGVIKTGQKVFTLESRPALLDIFRRESRRQGAHLHPLPKNCARRLQDDSWDLNLRAAARAGVTSLPATVQRIRLGLRGRHQGPQAALAVSAAGALLDLVPGRRPAAATIRRALAGVHLTGRFERRRLAGNRILVADGAHNPAAARALARTLATCKRRRPLTMLFGALADKDVRLMLRALHEQVDTVILTQPKHRRALKINDLAVMFGELSRRTSRPPQQGLSLALANLQEAWSAALDATPSGGILLVTGSFYLLGDLWPQIRRRPLMR